MALSKEAKTIERLAKRENADIYLYSAPILPKNVNRLRTLICSRKSKRPNAILFITTGGGDPDAAFRLATCLCRNYESVALYAFGPCKSAGTLVALGADRIVLGDFGELGPLDVQLAKPDELMPTSSGLDIFQAVGVVTNSAFEAFQNYWMSITLSSEGHISAKTSAEIATALAVGLFAPMTAQIEPERLGEVQRAITIAKVYGERLNRGLRGNLKKGALEKLVQGYPTHGYVIDLEEAKLLFKSVRHATPLESECAAILPGAIYGTTEPITLDVISTFVTRGAPHATQAKSKRPRGAGKGPGAKPGNIAQLRPDPASNAAPAEGHDNSGGAAAREKPAKKTSPGAAE